LIVLAAQFELKRWMGMIIAEIAISPSGTAAHRGQGERLYHTDALPVLEF
jgi:hypothetical protein